jgi:uncharacterized protein DUF3306
MSHAEDFLARWSRRKAEHRSPARPVEPATQSEPATPSESAPEMNPAPETAADLNSASLEFSSDFSRFVCDGISNAVQTAALRRLWVTDPIFGASDGLDVYRADYTVGASLETAPASLKDVPAAANRVLQTIAVEQCAVDRPASTPAVRSCPQNDLCRQSDVASGERQETSASSKAQEPQSSE